MHMRVKEARSPQNQLHHEIPLYSAPFFFFGIGVCLSSRGAPFEPQLRHLNSLQLRILIDTQLGSTKLVKYLIVRIPNPIHIR